MESPYRSPSSTFSELLNAAQRSFSNSFSQLEEDIYKLWCSPYYFSTDQRPNVVILKENKTKAFQTTNFDQNLCVIEPCLSRSIPSQISFKVSQGYANSCVGICLNNVVKALRYRCQVGSINQGCFMLRNNGCGLHHTDTANNNKAAGKAYRAGETVTVEFNPTTGIVTYTNSKKEVLCRQETGILSSEKSPISFCVLMDNSNEEVAIVADR